LKNSTALPEIIHTAATVRKEYKKAWGQNINVSEAVLTHSSIWIVLFALWLPLSLKQLSYEKLQTGFNKYFKCYW
jgi:hypothetical protein